MSRLLTRTLALVGAAALGWLGYRAARPDTVLGPVAAPTFGHRGGSGTPLLLLHGVGGTWDVWRPVLPYLEPHHDVLAPTLPGHGGAAPLPDGVAPTIDALVDAVEAVLDEAGLDRVHVVGNSLGGWIALELARRGRASSLVLFGPAGAWTSRRRIAARATGIRWSVAALTPLAPYAEAIAARSWLRRAILSTQVAHPDRVPPEALAATLRAPASATLVQPLLRELPDTTLESLPVDPQRPVRIVWAERDRVIPFERFGEPMVSRIQGAELVRAPGIGHVPMSDDPELVARLVLDVTRAVDARTATPTEEPG